MPRQLFTAEDIRRLAREHPGTLVLREEDILTHEAADVAYALGVKIVRERDTGPHRIQGADGAAKQPLSVASHLPSLKVVSMASIQVEPFRDGSVTPGTNVWWKEALGPQDGSPILVGYMSLDRGELQRTTRDDELVVVLEGELVVTRGADQVRGKTGDLIYLPGNSIITLGTPGWARFVYAGHSAFTSGK